MMIRRAWPMVVAMLIALLGAAACDDSNAPEPNPLEVFRPPTPTATPEVDPARIDLSWEQIADTTSLTYGRSYLVDTRTADLWAIVASHPEAGEKLDVGLLAWSPAGEALVRVETALFLSAPGESFRQLIALDEPTGAVWSPDGALIALRDRVIDPDRGRVIAELDPAALRPGVWSLDGQYLAYQSRPDEDIVQLIWDREANIVIRSPVLLDTWSPNNEITYSVTLVPTPVLEKTAFEIRSYNIETGKDELITTINGRGALPSGWSFDGRYLAVEEHYRSEQEPPNLTAWRVRIVDTTGGTGDVIIDGARWVRWLSEEHTLVLTGNVCGDFDAFTVDADGSNLINRTDSPDLDLFTWPSLDGRQVAFRSIVLEEQSRRSDLVVLDVASGAMTTAVSGAEITPSGWSPDGRYLVFGVALGRGLCEGAAVQQTTRAFVE